MPTKTKNIKTASNRVAEIAQQAGLVLMTAAVTLGMMELPDRAGKIIIPNQPAFQLAENNIESKSGSTFRREREETGPHYISYSVAQRTPSRAGKR